MKKTAIKQPSQAERLVQLLRRKSYTWGELGALMVSQCPWKRLGETGTKYLKPGEAIQKKAGPDGLLRIRVVKVQA